jgi:hypothetical protein
MVLFPPAASFTYQVTAVFCVFVTVAENCCEPPSATDAEEGASVTVIGLDDAAVTVTAFGWLTTPPGFGFETVTLIEPTCAAVATPVAVRDVAEMKVVASGTPPNKATAPGTKFAPPIVSVIGPVGIELGLTPHTHGVGCCTVTWTEPDFDGTTVLVAVTVTTFGVGATGGAMYKPVAEIVPMVGLPPETEFTDQVTVFGTISPT